MRQKSLTASQRIVFSKVYTHSKCLPLVAELEINQSI